MSAEPRAKFLAGGTNLLHDIKLNVESPIRLVDVNHLPLAQIQVTDSGVRIGAMVRNSDLAYHEQIRNRYPVFSEALLSGCAVELPNKEWFRRSSYLKVHGDDSDCR